VNVSQSRSLAARHFSGIVGRTTSMERDILEKTTDNRESGSTTGVTPHTQGLTVTHRTLNKCSIPHAYINHRHNDYFICFKIFIYGLDWSLLNRTFFLIYILCHCIFD
jgi:hypothetical protein